MNGGQVMVIVIVAIVMVASIIRAGIRASTGHLPQGKRARQAALEAVGRDDAETRQLRDEVKTLKDRLAVLERITVEKENSLEREIEALRDR